MQTTPVARIETVRGMPATAVKDQHYFQMKQRKRNYTSTGIT